MDGGGGGAELLVMEMLPFRETLTCEPGSGRNLCDVNMEDERMRGVIFF